MADIEVIEKLKTYYIMKMVILFQKIETRAITINTVCF